MNEDVIPISPRLRGNLVSRNKYCQLIIKCYPIANGLRVEIPPASGRLGFGIELLFRQFSTTSLTTDN